MDIEFAWQANHCCKFDLDQSDYLVKVYNWSISLRYKVDMFKIVNLQIAILTLSSILMLMVLFAPAAYASPCHGYEQDTPQINQVPVNGQGFSGTITAIKSNVIQHNSGQCCMVICNTLCSPNNIPVHSLSISSFFEKRYPADLPKINHQNDADHEDTQTNLKLQAYYQISNSTASPILQTTLKHRILLI